MKKRIIGGLLCLVMMLGAALGMVSCGTTSTLDYADMDLSEYIKLGQYLGLTIDVAQVDEIDDELFAEKLLELSVKNATTKLITDRGVKETDTIKLTYTEKNYKDGSDSEFSYGASKTIDKFDVETEAGTENDNPPYTKDFKDALLDKKVGETYEVTVKITKVEGEESTTTEYTYDVTVLAIYDYHKTTEFDEDNKEVEATVENSGKLHITVTKNEEAPVDVKRLDLSDVGKRSEDWYQSEIINALIGKKVGETVTVEYKENTYKVKINYIYAEVKAPASEGITLAAKGLGYTEELTKNDGESASAFEARKQKAMLEYISKELELEETLKKNDGETDEALEARVFDLFKADYKKTLNEERDEQLHINRVNGVWQKAIENATVLKFVDKNLKNYVKETIDNLNTDYQNNEQMYALYQQYGIANDYYKTYETLGDYIADNTDYSKDNYKAEIEAKAEEVAKEAMVLYAIAKAENITVSDEEYKARLAEYAKDAGYEDKTAEDGTVTTAVDAFLEDYESYYTEDQIRTAILWEKVVDKLAEGATVNYK